MIRLGLRLTLGGGKEAAVRLAITTLAVGIGVGLLLITLGGMNAINAQNARAAWLSTGFLTGAPGTQSAPPRTSADPVWWQFSSDHFNNEPIFRVDLAATGPTSPVPPGIPHLPGAGQYYASPGLVRLLREKPASQLGDRFPGTLIGTIGPSALPSPNFLIVVIGHSQAEMTAAGAAQVTSINTDAGAPGPFGFHNSRLQVILAVGALALLFPVLIFIGTATRLAAARREQRFAAVRLVGATPRQVSVISAIEATMAAIAGVAVGFGVFFLVRPLVTRVDFTGLPFAPGDLKLSSANALVVALGVPIAAAAAARVALRRVRISPLGVTRRVTPPPPRIYRLIPLVAGIGELAYFGVVGQPKGTSAQIEAYFSGCFLMLAGLLFAGPWLTMVGSRVMARRADRPAVLLAGRRLADNPRVAFRSISGLIIALFATSVSVGVITTILYNNNPSLGTSANRTLIEQLANLGGPPPPGPAVTVPPSLLHSLAAIHGVQGTTIAYLEPGSYFMLLASCDQLARTPALGRCAPGASVAAIDSNQVDIVSQFGKKLPSVDTKVWPAATYSATALSRLVVGALIVETDGSTSALETARTSVEVALPNEGPPTTLREINDNSRRTVIELQQMTNVVIVVSLIIAGCSLAVSVTGGINERKRPFSLLRLTGVSLSTLRRVVGLEAAVPLLVVSVLAAAMGFLAAGLFLTSQLNESLRPPGAQFYGLVVAGLVAAFAVIGATLPIVDRITGPETARNE